MGQFDSLRGNVIMFDGPDWVGKTTQIALVRQMLENDGQPVYVTRLHGGTPFGEALRTITLSKQERPPKADLYVLLAIYTALADDINQRRHSDSVILIDRSPFSIWAYQVRGSGLDASVGQEALDKSLADFQADLILFYKAPWETLLQHAEHLPEAKHDYFESKPQSYFQAVMQGYDEVAKRYHIPTIEASDSIETVQTATTKLLEQLAARRRA